MLYRFGASTPLAQLLDGGVFLTYSLCALLMVAFTVAVSLNRRIGWNDAAFGALVAAFLNSAFMGVPLLVALLGAQAARHSHPPIPLGDYLPVAAFKLLLHPLLVLLVGSSAIWLGLGLDRFALTVLVLVAALPSASNVSLLAERFGADNGRIARIILVSTAAASVSFSLAVNWLR